MKHLKNGGKISHAPAEVVTREPWSFVILAAGAGLAAGALFRLGKLRLLRKALGFYILFRRWTA